MEELCTEDGYMSEAFMSCRLKGSTVYASSVIGWIKEDLDTPYEFKAGIFYKADMR